MLGIILALLCAIFIAFSQLSLKKSYKELPPSVAFFFDAVFGLLIWVPLALIIGISGDVSWGQAFIFALISAILSEAIVFYALSHGELAVTTTVLATYPVYTVILSRFLNNEILSKGILIFVCMAILGSIVASLPDKLVRDEFRINKGILWPFIAAICIGLSDTISKGYINRSNDFSFLLALGVIQIPVAIAYLKMEKQKISSSIYGVINKLGNYRYALLGGLFNIVGTGFLWLSFSFSPASIASPITATNGVLTVIFSRLFLKEKISSRKYIGITMAFIGILGIVLLKS